MITRPQLISSRIHQFLIGFIVIALCWFVGLTSAAESDPYQDAKREPNRRASAVEWQAERLETQAAATDNPQAVASQAQNLRALAALIRRLHEPKRTADGKIVLAAIGPAQQKEVIEAVLRAFDSDGDGVLSIAEQGRIPEYVRQELLADGIQSLPKAFAAEGSTTEVPAGFESYYAALKRSSTLTREAMVRPLTARELFDLSVNLFGCGRFLEAALAAQLGLGQNQSSVEKAALFGVIAQSRGALGSYQEAANAALEGHRLSPLSKELAAMRVVYCTKVGNGAQLIAAEDALAGLEEKGDRVFLGPLVSFLWQNRTVVVAIVTTLGPIFVDQIREQWPQHKATIDAGVKTIRSLWEIQSKFDGQTSTTK